MHVYLRYFRACQPLRFCCETSVVVASPVLGVEVCSWDEAPQVDRLGWASCATRCVHGIGQSFRLEASHILRKVAPPKVLHLEIRVVQHAGTRSPVIQTKHCLLFQSPVLAVEYRLSSFARPSWFLGTGAWYPRAKSALRGP